MRAADRDPVADFYDANPYPPPVEDLDGEITAWADGHRRRVEHARLWPSLPFRDDHSILVAGCGTFQAGRYGVRYPNASVVGIDVSAASVAATRHLIERHGLANVEVRLLPIEEVGSLGRSFDHVVCTGVLHHLVDPLVGLRALRAVMAPEGALHLMLYATYGRAGIAIIQEYCRRLGVTPTSTEIGDLVSTLRELPIGHPIGELLQNSPDFADDGALADALLNPRDRSYTVPELLDLLDRASMRFGRWVRQAPYRPQCGAMSETPHAARIAALAEPEQFAAMELFRSTMLRHSVIAHLADALAPDPAIRWDDDAWAAYVPIRPSTIATVEERLPPGVSAALINRAHTERDLVFLADDATRRAFESVDGLTPLGEIPDADPEMFHRLWMHDLVMIDASQATSRRRG